MTRKTGKIAVKARQLTRSAKMAKYKRDLAHAGVSLSLPKPTKKAMKEKEEELKKLYQELFPKKAEAQDAAAETPADQNEPSQTPGEEEHPEAEQFEEEDESEYNERQG